MAVSLAPALSVNTWLRYSGGAWSLRTVSSAPNNGPLLYGKQHQTDPDALVGQAYE